MLQIRDQHPIQQHIHVRTALRTSALLLAAALLFCGCGAAGHGGTGVPGIPDRTITVAGHKIVLTTGFLGDELFTIKDAVGRESELRIYDTNLQREYEKTYGSTIWTNAGNEGLADAVKDNALARLSRVKVLNLMARDAGLQLNEEEDQKAAQAAGDYYGSLNETEREYFQADEDELTQMYQEYALAWKEYNSILSGVDTEVSDDEARTVTCQQILIRTYTTASDGTRTGMDAAGQADAKSRADAILQEIRDGMANLTGVTFDTYISRYNEGDTARITVSRGSDDPALEQAAFSLDVGKISDVIQTKDGYRILKCIAGSDRAEMDENKKTIAAQRQKDAFEKALDAYEADLDYNISEEKYKAISLVTDDRISTDSFFATYDQYFSSEE